MRRTLFLTITTAVLLCGAKPAGLPAAEQAALARITADGLKADLTYLASDELEGRGTPSKGLDTAADYIAAAFKAAGLEPAGPNGTYFQTADLFEVTVDPASTHISLSSGSKTVTVKPEEARVRAAGAIDVTDAAAVRLTADGPVPEIAGKVVIGPTQPWGREDALHALMAKKPALILLLGEQRGPRRNAERKFVMPADDAAVPVLRITNKDALALLEAKNAIQASVHFAEPQKRTATAHNVAGIVRGSNPSLRNQYVLLTAHYDHLGIVDADPAKPNADRIFNGANDDGSGTVSVMAIARAIAALPTHPKRSIVFMTFFGEEKGLLGAYYYVRHPLVPLRDTVADVQLEQVGRTDDDDGKRIAEFAFTGAGFSNLPATMTKAAESAGAHVFSKKGSDDYFARSDNYAFALAGIVAHTIAVAFDYPDYHGLADTADKIDYTNFERIDRAIAAGVIALANDKAAPRWSEEPKAAMYRAAAGR